jgi:predicted dehydrogenase
MKKRIGLGFIGCGGHSGRHADVLNRMPDDFKIVGALDANRNVAEKFLTDRGLRENNNYHDSISKFFKIPGMDAVLIGTPHKYHLGFCELAVEEGKHILCEKPLWEGPLQEEGKHVIAEAAERKLIFSSCHLRRFEKEYIFVKEHLPSYAKLFGEAVEVRFQFFYHEPSTGWKMDDSLLLDHMNHEIDLVHFLFGHSPTKFWRLSHGFDEYRVAGKTEGGLGIWFTGYRKLKSHTFRNELELIYERGRVRTEIVLDSETGQVNSTVIVESFENDIQMEKNFPSHSYDDALVGVMKNFAAAIRGEESCYLTAQDLFVNTMICNELVVNEFAEI